MDDGLRPKKNDRPNDGPQGTHAKTTNKHVRPQSTTRATDKTQQQLEFSGLEEGQRTQGSSKDSLRAQNL